MSDSRDRRLVLSLATFGRREAAALALVAALVVLTHVVAPLVVPGHAVFAQYAAYLVVFSVWMAWFVDWLAVWLGEEPHPSERDDADRQPER